MSTSEERKLQIKEDIARLVEEYATITNHERTEEIEGVLVNGWVLFAEYETKGLMDNNAVAHLNIIRQDQSFSMSRGLYELGGDNYRG